MCITLKCIRVKNAPLERSIKIMHFFICYRKCVPCVGVSIAIWIILSAQYITFDIAATSIRFLDILLTRCMCSTFFFRASRGIVVTSIRWGSVPRALHSLRLRRTMASKRDHHASVASGGVTAYFRELNVMEFSSNHPASFENISTSDDACPCLCCRKQGLVYRRITHGHVLPTRHQKFKLLVRIT